ncbi:MAG: ligase-associated DNA damage response exonuclease [Planctomycetota bacterium]|nr:ligase-associated DNA damage response exonuclease [Planctomycetota bacterium]
MPDLIRLTSEGLYCEAGAFHVDPWRPVERAVITHAHSDHARPGSQRYLTTEEGRRVLATRLGDDASIDAIPYESPITINDVAVSLHPAGHVLGAAQIRIEHRGRVWVISGDYKVEPDPTCRAFEPVPCHCFITESTFGLPIYRWKPAAEIAAQINDWWRANQRDNRTSIIFAYALGKAQRILAALAPDIGPILVHGAVARLCEAYEHSGVALPPWRHATPDLVKQTRGSAIVIAPPSAEGSPWIRKFGPASTAVASGWMQIRGARRRRAVDRGFILSDHADWPGLLNTIEATGAERIGVTHGYSEPMVRFLRETGRDAWVIPTRFEGESPSEESADTNSPESANSGGVEST